MPYATSRACRFQEHSRLASYRRAVHVIAVPRVTSFCLRDTSCNSLSLQQKLDTFRPDMGRQNSVANTVPKTCNLDKYTLSVTRHPFRVALEGSFNKRMHIFKAATLQHCATPWHTQCSLWHCQAEVPVVALKSHNHSWEAQLVAVVSTVGAAECIFLLCTQYTTTCSTLYATGT